MSYNGNRKGDDDEGASLNIKVRGLPWSTTVEEIINFFDGCAIANGREGVFIVMTKEGRPSGEAFVEMETEDDMEKALKRDREYVGTRYIEVFRCKRSEMEWVVRRSGSSMDNTLDDGCVRLRGLPFGCSKEEIAQFFTGLEIVPNGITLPMDSRGRSTGEAFVQFRTKEIAEKALLKHKEKIGHRYIEIFRSSLNEIFPEGRRNMNFSSRPGPYDVRDRYGGPNRYRGGNGGGGGGGSGFGPSGPIMPPGGGGGLNGMAQRGFRDDMDDDEWSWRWGPRGGGNGGGGGGPGPIRNFNVDFGGFGGGPTSYGNNGGGFGGGPNAGPPGPHIVHMRGLPFRATKQDIADFFRPVIPLSIDLSVHDKGRAEVEFRSHDDALMAMSKDKSFMSHRYIELFLDKPGGSGGPGGPGGRGGTNGPQGRGGGGAGIPGSRFKRF